MEIILNGEKKIIDINTSLKDLINRLPITEKKFVSVVNGEIVKDEDSAGFILKENSSVELISIVGGG